MILFLLILLIGALATDWKTHKIYNRWVVAGVAAGLLTALWRGGVPGLAVAAFSMCFALALLFPVYLIGGVGAGDVKLFAAAAAFLTWRETALCVLLSFVVGAAISLGVLLVYRGSQRKIRFALPILVSILFIRIAA